MRILNTDDTLIWSHTLISSQEHRGRERRRMAVAEDQTSTPTNSPHLHRAETCVAAAQGKGVAHTLQTGAVSGFGCMAFTPPISKTQRTATLSTHKEAQLNHIPTTGGGEKTISIMLVPHKTRILLAWTLMRCFKSICRASGDQQAEQGPPDYTARGKIMWMATLIPLFSQNKQLNRMTWGAL